MFFPRKEDIKTNRTLISNARLLCAGCPVRKECLHFAVDNVITHGLYGGVMPKDRRLGKLQHPNGDMPFTQILKDFKTAYGLGMTKPIPKDMYPELAKAINRTLSEVKDMMKAPDTVVLKSGN